MNGFTVVGGCTRVVLVEREDEFFWALEKKNMQATPPLHRFLTFGYLEIMNSIENRSVLMANVS
jgi:hypothetical protein